jgi:hypothetical protein
MKKEYRRCSRFSKPTIMISELYCRAKTKYYQFSMEKDRSDRGSKSTEQRTTS